MRHNESLKKATEYRGQILNERRF